MTISGLTLQTIRNHVTARSFERGEDLCKTGAVESLIRRENTVHARVRGSEYAPYKVMIRFDKAGISEAYCTCPYDWGGWCKHIVAALLACLNAPESIETRPDLDQALESLTPDQLRMILKKLADEYPNLTNSVEYHISQLQTVSETEAPSRPAACVTADPAPFHRQVCHIIWNHEDDRNPAPALEQIGNLLEKPRAFIEHGDGINALAILDAVIRAYAENWFNLDGSDGESGEFFHELDQVLAEALLTAELSQADCDEWYERLESWEDAASDYGLDDPFRISFAVLEQGWDYPPLKRVFEGEMTEKGAWEDEVPEYADDLAQIRLRILARREQYSEYLRLAEAEGQTAAYLTMLVRLGRDQEAVTYALKYLGSTQEALTLARALREQDKVESALHIAEHGLGLEGGYSKKLLADWCADLAEGMGARRLALKAAEISFRHEPGLSAYLRLRDLAEEADWPDLRKKFLTLLRGRRHIVRAQVDIFLHEGLVDAAIEAVDAENYYEEEAERVMDAALEKRPEWVIGNACKRADAIMNAGDAKRYHVAVRWLGRGKAACLASGKAAEWEEYFSRIKAAHSRKYKLMGMLEEL